MAKKEEKDSGLRTYLIEFENGVRQKIEVPESWKVTFGPAVGGKNRSLDYRGEKKMPLALRFYESDTKQRAIFTNVVSFRDLSIKIQVEKVRVSEKDGFMECEGVRKRTSFQASVREWIDPDAENPRPLLPKDTEMFNSDTEEL